MKDTSVTAADWLEVRARVAQSLKTAGSEQREPTRERIAEQLILAGYIDVDFVKAEMAEEKRVIAEAEETRNLQRRLSDSQLKKPLTDIPRSGGDA